MRKAPRSFANFARDWGVFCQWLFNDPSAGEQIAVVKDDGLAAGDGAFFENLQNPLDKAVYS